MKQVVEIVKCLVNTHNKFSVSRKCGEAWLQHLNRDSWWWWWWWWSQVPKSRAFLCNISNIVAFLLCARYVQFWLPLLYSRWSFFNINWFFNGVKGIQGFLNVVKDTILPNHPHSTWPRVDPCAFFFFFYPCLDGPRTFGLISPRTHTYGDLVSYGMFPPDPFTGHSGETNAFIM